MNKTTSYLPDDLYRSMMENLPIMTVDIVLFNPDLSEVLLGKRLNQPAKDEFFTFGGRMYLGESFQETATRKAKDELGLIILPESLVLGGIINEIWDCSPVAKVPYHTVNVYFGYRISTTEIKLDTQHSEAVWFSVNDPSLHPNVKERIRETLKAMHA